MAELPNASRESLPLILGVIDVGSNSIKCRIVEARHHTRRTLADIRYPVQLGRGTFSQGCILDDDLKAGVEAFRDFAQRCRKLGTAQIIAVGTSAMRESSNAQVFVQRVEQETGVRIRIISGAEEARIVAASVVSPTDAGKHHLVIDIGGGSTEVICTRADGRLNGAVSLRLGAVRLAEELGMPTVYTEKLVYSLRDRIRIATDSVSLPVAPPDTGAVGTGGTIRTLVDICFTSAGNEDRCEPFITGHQMENLLSAMTGKTAEQLVKDFGLDQKRAQIIVPGTVILSDLMKLCAVNRLTLRDCGVREGLLNEALSPGTLSTP